MNTKIIFKKKDGRPEMVYVKMWEGRHLNTTVASGIKMIYEDFSAKKPSREVKEVKKKINDLLFFVDAREPTTADEVKQLIKLFNGEIKQVISGGLLSALNDYRKDAASRMSKDSLRQIDYIIKLSQRWEWSKGRQIQLSEFNPAEFDSYIKKEYEVYLAHPEWFKATNSKRPVKERAQNGVSVRHAYMKAFFNWLLSKKIVSINPYNDWKIKNPTYPQEPIFLTPQERDAFAQFKPNDERKQLCIDIFIWMSWTSQRWSDSQKMTQSNINKDTLVFVANKTKENKQNAIQVPLKPILIDIIKRYKGKEGEYIFPRISQVTFDQIIKIVARDAGLDRSVIINKEGKINIKPLYEVISAHMARRTFVGNAINAGYGRELISDISGHAPNSKAFNRYYSVREETKKNMLDNM